MLDKIEEFLFDIMGLIVPGIVAVITLFLSTSICLNWEPVYNKIKTYEMINSILGKFVISSNINNYPSWGKEQYFYVISLLLLISYLIGHIAKVFSKYFYSAGVLIFDKGIIKVISFFVIKIKYNN